jgi:4-hydroxy-2-oxoglutarate aldolase
MGALKLKGIYPACITPFTRDGAVDRAAMRHNVEKWVAAGCHGLLVLGSTGEFVHLDDHERDEAITAAREACPKDRVLSIGVGHQGTAQTIRQAKRAAELGADVALVVTPFFYKAMMTHAALVAHYTAVADASPIPVLIYNVPPFTGLNIETQTVVELSKHPNIVGMKDSHGDVGQVAAEVSGSTDGFAVFTGAARVLQASIVVGAAGGNLAVGNIAAELSVAIYNATVAGNHDEARRLQPILTKVEAAVVRTYGIGGYKYALDLLGYRGGVPRAPLQQPDEAAQARIREALRLLEVTPA